LVQTGKVRLDPLVTHAFDLDRWEEGFDVAATSAECLRVAIEI
jgi:(R,R)-butanediol dehydrogenase/meso-butanediol dehydrogenase/diacetyl reductase/L-iditol 2-dehydrogenase